MVTGAGCGGPTAPSSPAPPAIAGVWTGQITDTSGPAEATWQLTQSGASISGSVALLDPATGFQVRGSVSGTLGGSALQFSLTVPVGGFDAPYSNCSADIVGDAQATSSSIVGEFSGTNSCTGPISSGRVTLSRRP